MSKHLGATPKYWQKPKSWLTPEENMIFLNFAWKSLSLFMLTLKSYLRAISLFLWYEILEKLVTFMMTLI